MSIDTIRELSTRRGTAWAVLGGVVLLALIVGAVAGHHAPAPAPTAASAVSTMPNLVGESVSAATAALHAQFPHAQVAIEGGDPNPADLVETTSPAAGSPTADAGLIALYPGTALPTLTSTTLPTPTTTDAPAPDTGSGDSSSSDGGGVYVPHPHAHVCVGGRHVHVCA